MHNVIIAVFWVLYKLERLRDWVLDHTMELFVALVIVGLVYLGYVVYRIEADRRGELQSRGFIEVIFDGQRTWIHKDSVDKLIQPR